jgi:polar amino acid transport system substrate-binding protein
MSGRRGSIAVLGVTVAVALLVAACSGDASLPSEVTGVASADTAPPATVAPECTDAEAARDDNVRSYPPLAELPSPGDMPSDSTMRAIQDRGRLIAGVSGDTLLFGARNSLTGQIEGFDIDMVTELARAIFGDDLDGRIEYKVITYADRLPSLEASTVDVVAHTMTINCRRWLRIGFSSEYFAAGQKVLVTKGSGFTGVGDLVRLGARVCAPEGSTNIDEISKPQYVDPAEGVGVVVIGKPDISDCLVAMQQGEADATTGDDTVLAGFAAQDPNTEVVGDAFTEEPYGLGFNAAQVDLVQFANAVIDDMRADGRWADIYQRWLLDTGALPGDEPPAPPEPDHSRPLP